MDQSTASIAHMNEIAGQRRFYGVSTELYMLFLFKANLLIDWDVLSLALLESNLFFQFPISLIIVILLNLVQLNILQLRFLR